VQPNEAEQNMVYIIILRSNYSEKEIEILDFPELVPPFILDYCDLVGQFEIWLEKISKNFPPPYPHCVMDGIVKIGKSTAVNVLLPRLIASRGIPHVIHQVSFEDYPTKSSLDFCCKLKASLEIFAGDQGVQLGSLSSMQPTSLGACQEIVKSILCKISENFTAKKIFGFFIWDEIQRWFQGPATDLGEMHSFFKAVVSSDNRNRSNQFFVVTGSGMITACNAYSRIKPNGHTILESSHRIHILPNSDDAVVDLLLKQVKTTYPDFEKDRNFSFGDLLSKVGSKSPATICYVLALSVRNPEQSLDQLCMTYEKKLYDEFMSDLAPMLDQLTKGQCKLLRDLANGIAIKKVEGWHAPFFDGFVKEYPRNEIEAVWQAECSGPPPDKTFGFIASHFTNMVSLLISKDGSKNVELIAAWTNNATLPSIYKHRFLEGLGDVGEDIASKVPNTWYHINQQ
jgi:hypothetical protein